LSTIIIFNFDRLDQETREMFALSHCYTRIAVE